MGLLRHVLFLCLLAALLADRAPAESPPGREYELKAAFLYNFTKFVDWPAEAFPDARRPLAICLLGNGPGGVALQALEPAGSGVAVPTVALAGLRVLVVDDNATNRLVLMRTLQPTAASRCSRRAARKPAPSLLTRHR
jgi:hypothetical protein